MNQQTLQAVEEIARTLLSKAGITGTITVSERDEESVAVDVSCEDPQLYIGEKGQTMSEILFILKSMVRKKVGAPVFVVLDINDYRKSKEHYVRELARTTADEVSLLKEPKELPAMNPAERRIVHMELQERSDIETESVGEGENRRVLVKLKERGEG